MAWYLGYIPLHYSAGIMVVLSLDKSLEYMAAHYYIGTIGLLIGIIIMISTPKSKT